MKKLSYFLLFIAAVLHGQTTLTTSTSPFRVCDDNTDLVYAFNLTDKNAEIHSHSVPSFIITYYETQADAHAGTNTIAAPTAYQNTSNPQTIYVRLINPSNPTGTYYLTSFVLLVQLPLIINEPSDLKIYQNPNTGAAKFDLNLQKIIIRGNQSNVEVKFFTSEADANPGTNPITTSCYTNTSNPQTVWVRMFANFEGGCYEVLSFTLEVSGESNPNGVVNIPDSNFKTKLLQSAPTNNTAMDVCNQGIKIDENSDGEIQTDELFRVRWLNLLSSNIASLEGLKMFPNLSTLVCVDNQLQELDLSEMYSIRQVDCSLNQLTTLDFSQTRLSYLTCFSNNLVSVNIKNGVNQELPPEFPGNWQNNPNLTWVCIDADEYSTINDLFSLNGYPMSIVTTDCNLLAADAFVASKGFTAYPNPAKDKIYISSDHPIQSVQLIDLHGRTIKTALIQDTNLVLDINPYSQGIYFLKVTTSQGTETQKIIKE